MTHVPSKASEVKQAIASHLHWHTQSLSVPYCLGWAGRKTKLHVWSHCVRFSSVQFPLTLALTLTLSQPCCRTRRRAARKPGGPAKASPRPAPSLLSRGSLRLAAKSGRLKHRRGRLLQGSRALNLLNFITIGLANIACVVCSVVKTIHGVKKIISVSNAFE